MFICKECLPDLPPGFPKGMEGYGVCETCSRTEPSPGWEIEGATVFEGSLVLETQDPGPQVVVDPLFVVQWSPVGYRVLFSPPSGWNPLTLSQLLETMVDVVAAAAKVTPDQLWDLIEKEDEKCSPSSPSASSSSH